MSAIDAYVEELTDSLRGSARRIGDISAEVRTGLDDLADGHRARGISRDDAERLAVFEFGPVRLLGKEFQELLATTESRRAALTTTLVIAVQPLVWGRPYDWASGGTASHFGSTHGAISLLMAGLGAASAMFMICALVRSHGGGRTSRRRLVRQVGRAALASTTLIGLLGVTLGAVSLATTGVPAPVMAVWSVAFLFTPLGWAARAGMRALEATPALTRYPA